MPLFTFGRPRAFCALCRTVYFTAMSGRRQQRGVADVFLSHVTWEDGHFELTGFNMKEKKDYDVSFNTTLSDVSEILKRISHLTIKSKGCYTLSKLWNCLWIDNCPRQKEVEASTLCPKRNFLRHRRTTQNSGWNHMIIQRHVRDLNVCCLLHGQQVFI